MQFKIESVNSCETLSAHTFEIKAGLAYNFLYELNYEYPFFRTWYTERVLKNMHRGTRHLDVVIYNKRIAAVLILKREQHEKKICTLRVHPAFQGNGIGRQLILRAFTLLETERPLISISDQRITQFSKLLKYFNFKLSDIKQGFYKKNIEEFIFNGTLSS